MKVPIELKRLLITNDEGIYTLHDVFKIPRVDFYKEKGKWTVRPSGCNCFKKDYEGLLQLKFGSLFKALQYIGDCSDGVIGKLFERLL